MRAARSAESGANRLNFKGRADTAMSGKMGLDPVFPPSSVARLPIIGITMGDAAGVGPEVVMKALARREVHAFCRPLVIGDTTQLERAGRLTGTGLSIFKITNPEEGKFEDGIVDCIDLALLREEIPFGRISVAAGEAAYRYIERAVKLALEGAIGAIC